MDGQEPFFMDGQEPLEPFFMGGTIGSFMLTPPSCCKTTRRGLYISIKATIVGTSITHTVEYPIVADDDDRAIAS